METEADGSWGVDRFIPCGSACRLQILQPVPGAGDPDRGEPAFDYGRDRRKQSRFLYGTAAG